MVTLLAFQSIISRLGATQHPESIVKHSTPSIAAHYQCYKRVRAVRHVVQTFRTAYPEAPLYMTNDGGDASIADVAAEFGAHYTYSQPTARGAPFLVFGSTNTSAMFIERLVNVAEASGADWVIMLEVRCGDAIAAIHGCNISQ